jgi:hypothetical protein
VCDVHKGRTRGGAEEEEEGTGGFQVMKSWQKEMGRALACIGDEKYVHNFSWNT